MPWKSYSGQGSQYLKSPYSWAGTKLPPISSSSRWDFCPVSAGHVTVKKRSPERNACALCVVLQAARTAEGDVQMLEGYDDLLTTEEACEALKIGKNALYALLADGSLKAYRNGRVWRIPKAAVEEYIRTKAKL